VACAVGQRQTTAQAVVRTPDGPSLDVATSTPAADRADLQAWIDTVREVYRSQAFATNLRSLASDYGEVWLSPNLRYLSVAALADALTGTDASFRYVPASVTLRGDADDNFASAGYAGLASDRRTGLASMTLGRLHLGRYRSSDVVERSCAVNTMAHEASHTLTNTRPAFIHAVEDTGNGAAPAGSTAPLASYLIGATAQCTYLQQQGRVPADGLKACIAVFGTNNYNSNRCSQFGNDEPVEERDGLAAPANPINA
jgi:hypothetical protein